jgi:hypothetical protein
MARQVMDLFEPFTLPSERVPELTGVDVDWASIFGPAILEDRHRTMAAGQLAASVLEAAAEARGLMARQVMDVFEPFTRPSTRGPELTGVDVDWARIFGPDVLEDGPGRDAGRRRHDDIGDEITEDPEEEHRHG